MSSILGHGIGVRKNPNRATFVANIEVSAEFWKKIKIVLTLGLSFPFPDKLNVFHVAKRTPPYSHWEPIYIGTNSDPYYDERLSWEGRSDKMTQVNRRCWLIISQP